MDPFCWFAVAALVMLALTCVFFAQSLSGTLSVVAFTAVLIGFDVWVNRPGNTP